MTEQEAKKIIEEMQTEIKDKVTNNNIDEITKAFSELCSERFKKIYSGYSNCDTITPAAIYRKCFAPDKCSFARRKIEL